MYHISNDKRKQKSAELIWKGMEQCLQEKNFDKLRINDIYQKSYVSRATFYRLFDSLEDVLVYECDQIYIELKNVIQNEEIKSKRSFFLLLIKKWMEQDILLKALVENNLTSIIYDTHMKNRELMKKIFLEDVSISDYQADYLVSILANIIPAAMNTWYLHGKNETPLEIYNYVCQSLGIIEKQLLKNKEIL